MREQTERLTQMTKTLLEMSNLQQVARNEQIQLAPMVEEIFTDLAPLAEKNATLRWRWRVTAAMIGSDALIYRLLFNLTENAVKYNRSRRLGARSLSTQEPEKLLIRVSDTGSRHPGGISAAASSSPSSGWISPAAGSTAARGWASRWCGRLPSSTAAPSGWTESSDRGTTIAVELPVQ